MDHYALKCVEMDLNKCLWGFVFTCCRSRLWYGPQRECQN